MKNCTLCGEEPVIEGCCYDCAVSCIVCGQPAHPGLELCEECTEQEIRDQENYDCSDAVTSCGDK